MRSNETWNKMVQLIGERVAICCQTADREGPRRRRARRSSLSSAHTSIDSAFRAGMRRAPAKPGLAIIEDHFALLVAAGY